MSELEVAARWSIVVLLKGLPSPGTAWAQADQLKWLRAVEALIPIAYPEDDQASLRTPDGTRPTVHNG